MGNKLNKVWKKPVEDTFGKKFFILLFAIIGFLTTIKLAFIYYNANFNPYALPSFCTLNSFIDCDGVAQTKESIFLGVPLAYWGMFLYIFMIFLLFVEQLKAIKFLKFLEVFKNPLAYISTLGFISFGVSIILACVSIFEIKKLCILCLFTYILNLLIAIIATDFKAGFLSSFKLSIKDFIAALKIKKYLISFILLALLGSGMLTYTTLTYCFAPQIKRYNEMKEYQKMENNNPYKVEGNLLGDRNGKLIVYIYTDYRCPICKIDNVILHRAVTELEGFQIIHKNLPLDNTCNKNVPQPFHVGSCMLSRYALAAEKQGHFWDFNSSIFEKQPQDEKAVLDLAKSIGLNTEELKADANSPATIKIIKQDIDQATKLGINGTPTMVINGKLYIGIKPYYELRDILLKAGANERKRKN